MLMSAEDKLEKIYQGIQNMTTELAKSIVHQEQHRKELDEHDSRLTNLDAYKNKTLGVVGILGVFFGALAGWLIHLLSK